MGLKLRCVEAASVVLQAEHRYTAKLTLAEAPEGEQGSGAQQQPQQQQPSDAEQKALEAGPAGQEGGAGAAAGQSQHQEADQLHPRPNRRPRARHRDPGHWRWRLISFELLPGAVVGLQQFMARAISLALALDRLSWPRHAVVGSCRCFCRQAARGAAVARAGLWGSQRLAGNLPTAMP